MNGRKALSNMLALRRAYWGKSAVRGQSGAGGGSMRPDAVINYPDFSRAEIVSTMLGLMLGLFLAGLDQTIVATALPYIARDLNAWQSMGWIVTAYLVSSTAATPIYGRLSDLYGRRRVVLVLVTSCTCDAVLSALYRI